MKFILVVDRKSRRLPSWAGPFLRPRSPKLAHNGLCGMFREGGGSNCGLCTEQELYELLSVLSADAYTSDYFCDGTAEL